MQISVGGLSASIVLRTFDDAGKGWRGLKAPATAFFQCASIDRRWEAAGRASGAGVVLRMGSVWCYEGVEDHRMGKATAFGTRSVIADRAGKGIRTCWTSQVKSSSGRVGSRWRWVRLRSDRTGQCGR